MDQRAELDMLRQRNLCHRSEEGLINMNSGLAQVVIGVRRSGKSTLCFNALESAGKKYAYVNFDDERLYGIGAEDLNDVLQVLYSIYGDFTHLFMDEVQNVDGWHLFANRLLRQGLGLIITGSNSRLLSSELATHLTGRHHTIELLPFSFADWCNYFNISTSPLTTKNCGLMMGAFDKYMKQGGFPELLTESGPGTYINDLFNAIVSRDIVHRFKIRDIKTFEQMAGHLLNVSPSILSKERLMETFGIRSRRTLGNYLSYLTRTYLLCTLQKYSAKSSERASSEKAYAIDVAFMNERENAFAGENLGWRLETMVYLELRRRAKLSGDDLYYFNNGSAEADFVVCRGNRAKAVYQVSYDVSNEKTLKRELHGAEVAARATGAESLYLITDRLQDSFDIGDYKVEVVPGWKFAAYREIGSL